jgi:hypothetical protein
MRIHQQRLRTKGWSEAEIAHAQDVLGQAELRKHPNLEVLEKGVFWGLLFLTIAGVVLVSLVIVPALIMLSTAVNAFLLVLLGLCLGVLFALIVQDVEWLKQNHHLLAVALLALLGTASIWFMVEWINRLERTLSFGVRHTAWTLGLAFGMALAAPYVVHIIVQWRASRAQHP